MPLVDVARNQLLTECMTPMAALLYIITALSAARCHQPPSVHSYAAVIVLTVQCHQLTDQNYDQRLQFRH